MSAVTLFVDPESGWDRPTGVTVDGTELRVPRDTTVRVEFDPDNVTTVTLTIAADTFRVVEGAATANADAARDGDAT